MFRASPSPSRMDHFFNSKSVGAKRSAGSKTQYDAKDRVGTTTLLSTIPQQTGCGQVLGGDKHTYTHTQTNIHKKTQDRGGPRTLHRVGGLLVSPSVSFETKRIVLIFTAARHSNSARRRFGLLFPTLAAWLLLATALPSWGGRALKIVIKITHRGCFPRRRGPVAGRSRRDRFLCVSTGAFAPAVRPLGLLHLHSL